MKELQEIDPKSKEYKYVDTKEEQALELHKLLKALGVL